MKILNGQWIKDSNGYGIVTGQSEDFLIVKYSNKGDAFEVPREHIKEVIPILDHYDQRYPMYFTNRGKVIKSQGETTSGEAQFTVAVEKPFEVGQEFSFKDEWHEVKSATTPRKCQGNHPEGVVFQKLETIFRRTKTNEQN